MEIGTLLLIELITLPILLLIGAVIGYYIKQAQYKKLQLEKRVEAERLLDEAKEQARLIEIQARVPSGRWTPMITFD
jgi:hypothetical protein